MVASMKIERKMKEKEKDNLEDTIGGLRALGVSFEVNQIKVPTHLYSSNLERLVGLFASFYNPFPLQKRPKSVWLKSFFKSIWILFENAICFQYVSSLSTTVFSFSFPPNPLLDLSFLLNLPVRTVLGRLICFLLVFFLCLLQTLSLPS